MQTAHAHLGFVKAFAATLSKTIQSSLIKVSDTTFSITINAVLAEDPLIITPHRKSWTSFLQTEKADDNYLTDREEILDPEQRVEL